MKFLRAEEKSSLMLQPSFRITINIDWNLLRRESIVRVAVQRQWMRLWNPSDSYQVWYHPQLWNRRVVLVKRSK